MYLIKIHRLRRYPPKARRFWNVCEDADYLHLDRKTFILLKHGGLWASSLRNPEFVELVLMKPEDFGVDPSETWRLPDVGELLCLPCR